MKIEEYGKWRAKFEEQLDKAGVMEGGDRQVLKDFLEHPAGARIIRSLFLTNQAKAPALMRKMESTEDALDRNFWIGSMQGTSLILEQLIEYVVEKSDDRPDPSP